MPDFELTQHLSPSAPPDLSAPLHLFTSHVSFHLSTHHSSFYRWPNNPHSTSSNSLSSPLQHHHFFSSDPRASLILSPRLNLPPRLVYLCLLSLSVSRSLAHPVISLSFQPTQSGNQSITPPIWFYSHLSVFVCECLSVSDNIRSQNVYIFASNKCNRGSPSKEVKNTLNWFSTMHFSQS